MSADPERSREEVFLNSVFFVLGFTLVLSAMGVLIQIVLSRASLKAVNTVRLVGGSVKV